MTYCNCHGEYTTLKSFLINKMRRIILIFLIWIAATKDESFQYKITFDVTNSTLLSYRARELTEIFRNDNNKEIIKECNDNVQLEQCKIYLLIRRKQLNDNTSMSPLPLNLGQRAQPLPDGKNQSMC